MAERYQSKHAAKSTAAQKGKLALLIISLVLLFCVLGGGVYALVHYVILAPPTAPTEAPTEAATIAEPTEAPTQAPTEPDYAAMAEKKLATMTDREKICQLFIASPEQLTGVDVVTMAGDATKEAIENYPVGGLIYNSANFEDVDQTKEMIANSQSYASIPMFIAVDEEGGDVSRVADKLGTTPLENMYKYKDLGIATARKNAKTIGSDISSLGFNLDFAPVADVLTNPDNTVIGERAYSDDYNAAAELVGAAVGGFGDGGVMCTLKHFPGHGGTDEDSHDGLAYVSATEDELKAGELLPFKSGIEAGADMVMVGHLVVSSVDSELPATLSPKVVPELLRKYLNYDGVVITDGMQMGAIAENYSYDEIVKGIFDADIDMILQPDSLDSYILAIEKALVEETITRDQLNAKVKRILTLKYSKGIIPLTSATPDEIPTVNVSAILEDSAINDPTEIPAA